MSAQPHVLVVGGGIAGCAVAVELAARGARVTLLEKERPGAGATGASAGMLAPQYEAPGADAAFRFGVACRQAYPPFVERLESLSDGSLGLRTDGMLVANRTAAEEEASRRSLDFQRAVGMRGEIVPPRRARGVHPGVREDVRSWLWLPDESQVDAQRLAVVLGEAVEGAGARLMAGAEVVAVESEGGRLTGVRLREGGRIAADRVVIAAGAWTAGIEGLPRALPVRPVRGQMLRLLPPEPPPWTLVADHQAHYLVPRVDGTVLVGSTMEEVGFEDSVTEEGRDALVAAATALVPALEGARVVEAWAGLRPISADGWPVLGPDPAMEGLLWSAGHGRNGILFAPLVGRALADLALEGRSRVEWEPFGVARFDAPDRGAPLETRRGGPGGGPGPPEV